MPTPSVYILSASSDAVDLPEAMDLRRVTFIRDDALLRLTDTNGLRVMIPACFNVKNPAFLRFADGETLPAGLVHTLVKISAHATAVLMGDVDAAPASVVSPRYRDRARKAGPLPIAVGTRRGARRATPT